MDLRRQLNILRRRLPVVVLATLSAGILAFAVSSLMPRVYEARATLLIGQSLSAVDPDYNQLLASQRLAVTYASLATRRPILEAVIDRLGLTSTPERLAARISAEPSQTTAFLTIAVSGTDPEEASLIANEVAARVIAASPTVSGRQLDLLEGIQQDLRAMRQEIDRTTEEIETLRALEDPSEADLGRLASLQDQLATLRSSYAALLTFDADTASNVLTLVEPANVPASPAAPNRMLLTLLAATLALIVMVALVFVLEYLDDSVRRPEDVEETTGLATLGTIGRLRGDPGRSEIYRLVSVLNPRSQAAEAYRSIRANIEFTSVDEPIRSLLIAGATAGEGKTVTAANLAVVFAQAGRRVLLVDGDLRRPGVHTIFRAPNTRGLTTLLLDDALDHERVTQTTEQPDLRILTTGPLPPNPAEILGSQRMASTLDRLLAAYDLVIVDSPPIQPVADAAVLSARMDATLLVIDAGRSRRQVVVRARETLARAGARVVGVVLNRVTTDLDADGYAAYGSSSPPTDPLLGEAGRPGRAARSGDDAAPSRLSMRSLRRRFPGQSRRLPR